MSERRKIGTLKQKIEEDIRKAKTPEAMYKIKNKAEKKGLGAIFNERIDKDFSGAVVKIKDLSIRSSEKVKKAGGDTKKVKAITETALADATNLEETTKGKIAEAIKTGESVPVQFESEYTPPKMSGAAEAFNAKHVSEAEQLAANEAIISQEPGQSSEETQEDFEEPTELDNARDEYFSQYKEFVKARGKGESSWDVLGKTKNLRTKLFGGVIKATDVSDPEMQKKFTESQEKYNSALAAECTQLMKNRERELLAENKTPEDIAYELQKFQSETIQLMLIKEARDLQRNNVEQLPTKQAGMVRKAMDKYSKWAVENPKKAKTLAMVIAAGTATGMATFMGTIGTGGALAYAGGKLATNAAISAALLARNSEAAASEKLKIKFLGKWGDLRFGVKADLKRAQEKYEAKIKALDGEPVDDKLFAKRQQIEQEHDRDEKTARLKNIAIDTALRLGTNWGLSLSGAYHTAGEKLFGDANYLKAGIADPTSMGQKLMSPVRHWIHDHNPFASKNNVPISNLSTRSGAKIQLASLKSNPQEMFNAPAENEPVMVPKSASVSQYSLNTENHPSVTQNEIHTEPKVKVPVAENSPSQTPKLENIEKDPHWEENLRKAHPELTSTKSIISGNGSSSLNNGEITTETPVSSSSVIENQAALVGGGEVLKNLEFNNLEHVVSVTGDEGGSLNMHFLYDAENKIIGTEVTGEISRSGPNPYILSEEMAKLDPSTHLEADEDIYKMRNEADFLKTIPKGTYEYEYVHNHVAEMQKSIAEKYGDILNPEKLEYSPEGESLSAVNHAPTIVDEHPKVAVENTGDDQPAPVEEKPKVVAETNSATSQQTPIEEKPKVAVENTGDDQPAPVEEKPKVVAENTTETHTKEVPVSGDEHPAPVEEKPKVTVEDNGDDQPAPVEEKPKVETEGTTETKVSQENDDVYNSPEHDNANHPVQTTENTNTKRIPVIKESWNPYNYKLIGVEVGRIVNTQLEKSAFADPAFVKTAFDFKDPAALFYKTLNDLLNDGNHPPLPRENVSQYLFRIKHSPGDYFGKLFKEDPKQYNWLHNNGFI